MKLLYMVAAALIPACCVYANDEATVSTDMAYVKVDMKTGGTKASKNADIDSDANKLEVMVKEIRVVKKDNTTTPVQIGNLELKFSDPTNETKGVAHKQVIGTGDKKVSNGTFKLTIDIFTGNGTVSRSNENTSVKEGDVRLSVSLDGFTFDVNDTKLMIKFMISSPSKPSKAADGGYNLGANAMAYISKKVEKASGTYDDVMEFNMMDEYFTMKLNKTEDSSYQISLILKLADYKEAGKDPNTAGTQSVHVLLLCFMLVVFKTLC